MTTLLDMYAEMRPQAKQRAGRTKDWRAYTPKETADAERLIRTMARFTYAGAGPYAGPVALRVEVYFERPKTVTRFAHVVKPDWDNLGKLVSDALNGVVYGDDKQITEAMVKKMYAPGGTRPGVRIVVKTAEGEA